MILATWQWVWLSGVKREGKNGEGKFNETENKLNNREANYLFRALTVQCLNIGLALFWTLSWDRISWRAATGFPFWQIRRRSGSRFRLGNLLVFGCLRFSAAWRWGQQARNRSYRCETRVCESGWLVCMTYVIDSIGGAKRNIQDETKIMYFAKGA